MDDERRIRQLELKFTEQEKLISELRDDIKSLKVLQNGDRKEYQKASEYHDTKKKKLFALFGELNERVADLATKTELQYVNRISHYWPPWTELTLARSLSKQLDDLKYEHTIPDFACL